MNPRYGRFLVLLLLGLAFSACTIRQDVTLNADGSGEATVRVVVQKFFVDYLLDLAEFAGSTRPRSAGVFDEAGIRAAFQTRPGVTVKEVRIVKPEEMVLELGFASIDDLVHGEQDLTQSGLITFRNDGGTRTLRLHLDRANFARIAGLVPSSDGSTETLLSVFGPQEGIAITEAEYLETMEFTLGEDGPRAIRESLVEIAVTVNGRLVSQKGGTVTNNTVLFRVPLLSILLLDRPLDYEVVFR